MPVAAPPENPASADLTDVSQLGLRRMIPASRVSAVLLAVPLLMWANGISAGPVQVGESDGHPEGTQETPATPAALSGRSLSAEAAPTAEASPLTSAASGSADSAKSASALAAEIIKEAEADSHASEQPQKTNKPQALGQGTTPNLAPRVQARATEDEWGLREMGKAAVHWLKESVPWLRSDADESGAGQHVLPNSADWSTSPLEGGRTERNAMAGSTQVPDANGQGAPVPWSTAGYGNTARQTTVLDPEQNLVQVVVKLVREVLEHPLTWLVVSLVVVGAIAMKKFDRRPK
jgi:hypothetical protein